MAEASSLLFEAGIYSILQEARLNGIHVVVGRQGASCDSVCKLRGQSCVPNKLAVLNQCDVMKKYMTCKGACLASVGTDQPAEVVHDAPKHLLKNIIGVTYMVMYLSSFSFFLPFRMRDHVCTLMHNLHFLVMVRISIQRDCASVHSVNTWAGGVGIQFLPCVL